MPTQIFSGYFDESTALSNQSYLNGIAGSQWEVFTESAHMTYVEEAAKYQRLLNAFLDHTL